MKIKAYITLFSAGACFYGASAFADWTWTVGSTPIDDAETWGLPAGTAIDLSDVDLVLSSKPDGYMRGAKVDGFEIKSLTLSSSLNGFNMGAFAGSIENKSPLLKIKNDFTVSTGIWAGMGSGLDAVCYSYGLDIGGNFIVNAAAGSDVNLGTDTGASNGFQRIYVGGNLEISGGNNVRWQTGDNRGLWSDGAYVDWSLDNPDTKIGGAMKISNGSAFIWCVSSAPAYGRIAQVGGLESVGGVRFLTSGASTRASLVLAKESGLIDSDYKGTVENQNSSILDVYMRNGGRQVIRMESSANVWNGSIFAENGKILLNNSAAAGTSVDVKIDGGKFGAAAAEKPTEGYDAGIAKINNFTWDSSKSGGGLIVNGKDSLYSTVDIAGETSFVGDEFVFYFEDFTEADIGSTGINLNSIVGWTNINNKSVWEANKQRFVAIIDGQQCVAEWTVTDYGLNVSITAIPEPATVALMLGVFAMSFAAYRKRKN